MASGFQNFRTFRVILFSFTSKAIMELNGTIDLENVHGWFQGGENLRELDLESRPIEALQEDQ